MSTLILDEAEMAATVDDFSALEQRILRAVELVKTERAAREQAEHNIAQLQSTLDAQSAVLTQTQEQVRNLERERDQVRQRVENMLKQLDEIAS
jgi:uncharacterized protein involved in exopolysaccharide biosynthesis